MTDVNVLTNTRAKILDNAFSSVTRVNLLKEFVLIEFILSSIPTSFIRLGILPFYCQMLWASAKGPSNEFNI